MGPYGIGSDVEGQATVVMTYLLGLAVAGIMVVLI